DYRKAGANGAAMRNLPIALVNVNNEEKLIVDSFINAIITHGHPRAIMGAFPFVLEIRYVLIEKSFSAAELTDYLIGALQDVGRVVANNQTNKKWLGQWGQASFRSAM